MRPAACARAARRATPRTRPAQVRQRYEETLRENEALKADARRRVESSMRREQKYESELNDLKGEVERAARPPSDSAIENLRENHQRVLKGVTALKDRTACRHRNHDDDWG